MKALEILKAFSGRYESAYGFNNTLIASLGDINEALKELASIEQRIEELKVPKSCYLCLFSTFEPFSENEGRWKTCTCAWSPANDNYVTPAQWCNAYKPKEQK